MSSDINVQTFSGKVNISNNLKVGSGHLFVNTTNNRVGLVTVNPHAGLHVNSNAYVDTDFRVGPSIVMNETSGRITAGSFEGDGSLLTAVPGDSGSWVNGASSNVHLATTGDSVGIGTTTVDSGIKLQVNGVVKATGFTGIQASDVPTLNQNTTGTSGGIAYTQLDVTAPNVTSGTWVEAGTTSSWGPPKFDTPYNTYAHNDAPGHRQWNIPTGMKSAYISQLTWNTGGYADVHGVQSDGGLVFLRRINTRQGVENTNEANPSQHDGSSITFIGSGLDSFSAIRITNKAGRLHLTGLAFTPTLNGTEGVGMVHPLQLSATLEASQIPTLNQNTTGSAGSATTAGTCSGNSATATTAGTCTGNSATATTAGTCSGNSATASSCSGNSATATTAGDADTVDGQHAHEMSWGHDTAHGTYNNFNTFLNTDKFGAHFAHLGQYGPSHSGSPQWYHQRMSLGSNHNNYSLQLAIPRNRTDSYLYYRNEEANTPTTWYKMRAGYADSAGTATTATNQSGGTVNATSIQSSGDVYATGELIADTARVFEELILSGLTMGAPPRVIHIDDSRSGCPPTQAANTPIMQYSLVLARSAYVFVSVSTILVHTSRADCHIYFGSSLQQSHLTASDSTSWNPVCMTAGGTIAAGTTNIVFRCAVANVVGCQSDWGGMQILVFTQ